MRLAWLAVVGCVVAAQAGRPWCALADGPQAAPLRVGADVVGDEWDAILKLTPPAAHASVQPERKQLDRESAPRQRREREKSSGREDTRNALPSGYATLKKSWHDAWPESSADITGEPRALVLHPVGRAATPYTLLPSSTEGGFDEAQIAVASQALGSWAGGPSAAPRLLDLIYNAARQFGVFHVHVVSGVRRDRGGSRHSHGLAADIVLPSVDDEELAAYFRLQGFVGVGVYPRAGFVHIDVRDRSYFWIDRSPPGRRYKIHAVRMEEAKAADEAAVARGQSGFVNPARLQKALSLRAKRRRARKDKS